MSQSYPAILKVDERRIQIRSIFPDTKQDKKLENKTITSDVNVGVRALIDGAATARADAGGGGGDCASDVDDDGVRALARARVDAGAGVSERGDAGKAGGCTCYGAGTGAGPASAFRCRRATPSRSSFSTFCSNSNNIGDGITSGNRISLIVIVITIVIVARLFLLRPDPAEVGGGGDGGEDARTRAGSLEADVEVTSPLVLMSVSAKEIQGVEVAVDEEAAAAEVATDVDAARALTSQITNEKRVRVQKITQRLEEKTKNENESTKA
ncbi:hypothetical protein CVT25_010260 [Psilocybe cyanescens]|uniref:Uncharacterized protein n=1 Tax=Psilocybe cyanescens TaxID=93625 RepID=A0A409XD84_PSICY|nr:hypothetical protein CVT25_010260 [Psilocybe cyanescens]